MLSGRKYEQHRTMYAKVYLKDIFYLLNIFQSAFEIGNIYSNYCFFICIITPSFTIHFAFTVKKIQRKQKSKGIGTETKDHIFGAHHNHLLQFNYTLLLSIADLQVQAHIPFKCILRITRSTIRKLSEHLPHLENLPHLSSFHLPIISGSLILKSIVKRVPTNHDTSTLKRLHKYATPSQLQSYPFEIISLRYAPFPARLADFLCPVETTVKNLAENENIKPNLTEAIPKI